MADAHALSATTFDHKQRPRYSTHGPIGDGESQRFCVYDVCLYFMCAAVTPTLPMARSLKLQGEPNLITPARKSRYLCSAKIFFAPNFPRSFSTRYSVSLFNVVTFS